MTAFHCIFLTLEIAKALECAGTPRIDSDAFNYSVLHQALHNCLHAVLLRSMTHVCGCTVAVVYLSVHG